MKAKHTVRKAGNGYQIIAPWLPDEFQDKTIYGEAEAAARLMVLNDGCETPATHEKEIEKIDRLIEEQSRKPGSRSESVISSLLEARNNLVLAKSHNLKPTIK